MMKKTSLILIIILVLIVLVGAYIVYGLTRNECCGPEDFLIDRALDLYGQKKTEGMIFNSQCLGVLSGIKGDYVVDIVHVPRTVEDNLPENQCEAYRNGSVQNFIELDKDGKLVRIVD